MQEEKVQIPVDENLEKPTEEMMKVIDEELQRIREGKVTYVTTIDLRTYPANWLNLLQQNILYLRQAVETNRSPTLYSYYKIYFSQGTPIYNKGTEKTQDGDYFTVACNNKSIYPLFNADGTCRIVLTRAGKDTNIDFNPTYTRTYCVTEACGIVVAEQIRFNTLDKFITDKQTLQDNTSRGLFNFMVSNYLDTCYKNWKNATNDPTILPEGVRVVVKWLP